jgi:hypothetical protein
MPEDLLKEVRQVAKGTSLSIADVMRQSIRLGLPSLQVKLKSTGRLTNVEPLTDAELERLYSEREDDEASIRRFIKAQPKHAE